MWACFAIALDTQMISDAKSFIWNFFGNLVNKADGTVNDFNSVYCNNCL